MAHKIKAIAKGEPLIVAKPNKKGKPVVEIDYQPQLEKEYEEKLQKAKDELARNFVENVTSIVTELESKYQKEIDILTSQVDECFNEALPTRVKDLRVGDEALFLRHKDDRSHTNQYYSHIYVDSDGYIRQVSNGYSFGKVAPTEGRGVDGDSIAFIIANRYRVREMK